MRAEERRESREEGVHFLRRASRLAKAARTLSNVGTCPVLAPAFRPVNDREPTGARRPLIEAGRAILLAVVEVVLAGSAEEGKRVWSDLAFNRDAATRSESCEMLSRGRFALSCWMLKWSEVEELSDLVPSFLCSVPIVDRSTFG